MMAELCEKRKTEYFALGVIYYQNTITVPPPSPSPHLVSIIVWDPLPRSKKAILDSEPI